MKWECIRADQYCESVRDGTHDTPKPAAAGYKLVTGKHIKAGQINPADAYCISEKDYNAINERSLVEQWDVLLSMIGTVGESAVVKEPPRYAIKNVALFKCGGSELKGRWLDYYLRSPMGQGHMSGNQKGSSQQFLSLRQLRGLPVPAPGEPYMRKAVQILSAYDGLMENGGRQIKLLEEGARRLYREWFVHLRFPGHEAVPVADGVPEGWRRGKLAEIAEFRRGKTITKSEIECGGVPVVAGGLEPAYYHSRANASAPVVTVSGSGANAGFVRMYHVDVFASDCSFIDRNSTPYIYFAYCFLSGSRAALDALQKGSAQPHVYAKDINALPLLIPGGGEIAMFQKAVEPFFSKIQKLERQIQAAKEARDRLLPKLISGEIEVK